MGLGRATFALVIAVGCGGQSGDSNPARVDAPPGGGTPDAPAVKPDAPPGGGTPDAPPGTPDAPAVPDAPPGTDKGGGSVTLSQSPTIYTATASFEQGGNGCTGSTAGPCQLFSCAAGSQPTPVSAGTITISGGQLPAPITLTPSNTNASYAPGIAAGSAFVGGDVIEVQGSGATVPAFDVTLTAPSSATLVAPALTLSPLHIDLGADFTVTWTAPANPTGTINLLLTEVTAGATLVGLTCTAPTSGGALTVTRAVLDNLPAGTGFISIEARSSKQTSIGDYAVTVITDFELGSSAAIFQ
jgi:hypothetical protein